MARHACAALAFLVMLATSSLLQTANAINEKQHEPKSKQDRDEALDTMVHEKPKKDAGGMYKGGTTSKRQKFADSMSVTRIPVGFFDWILSLSV
jgi:hypothetical protein